MGFTRFVLASLASSSLMGANPVLGTSPLSDYWDSLAAHVFPSQTQTINFSLLPGFSRRNLLRRARIQEHRQLDDLDSDSDDDGTRTVIVGTDEDKCNDEDPHYSTIAKALERENSGVTIQLCAEVYNEAVVVEAGFAVKFRGVGRGSSIVQPPSNAGDAIIEAGQDSNVELEDLTLDGVNGLNGTDAGAVAGFACEFCNASINQVAVTNIRTAGLVPLPSVDIFIRANSTDPYQLTVVNSVLPNVGSIGIFADGRSLTGKIKNNIVTKALEGQPAIGIQVSRQANFLVEGNSVSNFGEENLLLSSGITLFCPNMETDVIRNNIDSSTRGINLINSVAVDVQDNAISNVLAGFNETFPGFGVFLQYTGEIDPDCGPLDSLEDNIVMYNNISCVSPSNNTGVTIGSDGAVFEIFNNTVDRNSISGCEVGILVGGDNNTITNNEVMTTFPYEDQGEGTVFSGNMPEYTLPPTPAPTTP